VDHEQFNTALCTDVALCGETLHAQPSFIACRFVLFASLSDELFGSASQA